MAELVGQATETAWVVGSLVLSVSAESARVPWKKGLLAFVSVPGHHKKLSP